MIKALKSPRLLALLFLLLILGVVNFSIFKKEQHLSAGKVVLLALAPVDPRSLMQGDYMALRYEISRDVRKAILKGSEHSHAASDGYLIAELDANKVANFKALYTNQDLAENEILLQYRFRNNRIKFASNAFFFQEGYADVYQPARYGQFRVNNKGELLLAAMVDTDFKTLAPPKK